MAEKTGTNKRIEHLVDAITATYRDDCGINFIDAANLPVREKILEILDLLTELLFPGDAVEHPLRCHRYSIPRVYRAFGTDRAGLQVSLPNGQMRYGRLPADGGGGDPAASDATAENP